MKIAPRRLRAALLCALVVGAPCFAADAPRSAASITDFRVEDPVLMKERAAQLDAAEAALARGDTDAALAGFERAAGMLHAPDTEMGLVRSQMQAGQYRRALAFAAHTAGAHLEAPAASALYAWLLRVGGQEAYARQVLDAAAQRSAGNEVLGATQRAFDASGVGNGYGAMRCGRSSRMPLATLVAAKARCVAPSTSLPAERLAAASRTWRA